MSVRTWRGRRVDANHAAIVEAFRAHGWSVQSLAAIGRGCPDLLCAKDGTTIVVEVKTPKGKLTQDEERWRNNWHATVLIVRSVVDVEALAWQARNAASRAGHQ